MSKGVPLSEPLSGLVVDVCIPGAAPTTLAEPTTALCRASREERALGKLHYAAAANSPASSAPPLWEKLAPIRQHALPRTMGRSTKERSLASSGGVVGGFRRFLRKTRFVAQFLSALSNFECAARSRGLGLRYGLIVHP